MLDPDRAADAATRPLRDADLDRFDAELARLGFVLSLDLALTVRRLPNAAMQELRVWIAGTLAHATAGPGACPWCAREGPVGALDPCGHRVCEACWTGTSFAACPICHRRVARHEPKDGALAVVHLGFDVRAVARGWLARLLARRSPLAGDERDALEAVIDALGPDAIAELPARVPVRATAAIAVARLLLVSPDRSAMAARAAPYLATGRDVLAVANVLMGAPRRSLPRGLRRALLEALDRLPPAELADAFVRDRAAWQRIGEQLHPRELADRLPNAARAFAIARARSRGARWAGPIEAALAAGDAIAALERLVARPGELVRRARHLERVARAQGPDASAKLASCFDELCARAAALRPFARAVIDRALPDRHRFDLAALHAAARANVIYVRERDGTFTTYRRRDGESHRARLARLASGTADSDRLLAVPAADAPMLAVVARLDFALPAGSATPDADELALEISNAMR
ncbi:MAG TPA: RING finger family 4 domain-containing protein [Kofleriaceae bacterium]|nr:RING finger family 4 domain-containing protein [Kofleriaceae bacterium]